MSGTVRRFGRGSGLPQVGLLAALLVPLLPGSWAFSELAARRETARVDAHLRAALAAAVGEYGDVLDEAQVDARDVAVTEAVQRAFVRRDRTGLAALERRYGRVRLLLPDEQAPVADALPSVDVVDAGRRVGRVVVPIRIQGAVLEQLRRHTSLGLRERVVVLRGQVGVPNAERPADVELGGVEYRALTYTLRTEIPQVRLAVGRERAVVQAAVDDARRRTVVVAGVALLAVALLAYLFAPVLARTRERRRQRSQAERVLSQLSDGVLEVNHGGVITYLNPAAETLIGVAPEAAVGRPAADAIDGWPALAVRMRTDVPLDRDRWLSVAPVEADGGTVYTFRDVTRERRLDEMRNELIATVSHELRTPLAAVYGAAMTLQRAERLDAPMRDQLIGIIGHQAERLARIVDEILAASRAASPIESEPAAREAFDPIPVARAVVEDATARTGRTITLAAVEEAPTASGSPDDLRRVLDNLVDNAAKYSAAETAISVQVRNGGDTVRIAVSDEGPGIPRDEQDRIFERFYRLDPGMATGVGGTGLGLYIARRLVERMGGRLTVTSEPGAGATFVTELPRG